MTITRRQKKIIAFLGFVFTWGLFFADKLESARRLIEAPTTALSFWGVVSRMFVETTPLAWLILLVGFGCLLVATLDVWGPPLATYFPLLSPAPATAELASVSWAGDILDGGIEQRRKYYRLSVVPTEAVSGEQLEAWVHDVRKLENGLFVSINKGCPFQLSWGGKDPEHPKADARGHVLGIFELTYDGNLSLCTLRDPGYTNFNGRFDPGQYEITLDVGQLSGKKPQSFEVSMSWAGAGTEPEIEILKGKP